MTIAIRPQTHSQPQSIIAKNCQNRNTFHHSFPSLLLLPLLKGDRKCLKRSYPPASKGLKAPLSPPIPKPQITELGSGVPMESSLEDRKNSEKCSNIKLIKNLLIWTKVSLGFRSASRGLGRAVDFLPALPSCRSYFLQEKPRLYKDI